MSWCPLMCKLWPKPYPRNADDIARTMTPFPHPAHRTGLPNGEGDGVPDNSISCRCSPDEVIVWAFPNIPVNEWPELKIAIITFAIDRGAEWRVWVILRPNWTLVIAHLLVSSSYRS
jgi:hypothetical protein